MLPIKFLNLSNIRSRILAFLEDDLQKAGFETTPEMHLKSTQNATVVSLILVTLPFFLFPDLWFIGPAIPPIVFVVALFYPRICGSLSRRGQIEEEMPFALSYITIMAQSNTPIPTMFRSLASIETIKAIRVEVGRINRDITVFGHDPLTALEDAAKYCPNDTFALILNGMARTVRSGGDLPRFLATLLSRVYVRENAKLDTVLKKTETYSIATIMALIVVPACLAVMLPLMGAMGGGFDISTMYSLFNYVYVPLMFVLLWLMIDRAHSAGTNIKLPKEVPSK